MVSGTFAAAVWLLQEDEDEQTLRGARPPAELAQSGRTVVARRVDDHAEEIHRPVADVIAPTTRSAHEPVETKQSFMDMIDELKQLAKTRAKLTRAQKAELYWRTNHALTAYTQQLDASDPEQSEQLEAAYRLTKKRLRALKIVPPKMDVDTP